MQWPERRKECRSLAARGLAVATLLLVGVLPARALVIDAQYNAQESASPDFDPTGQLLQAMVTEATGLWQEIVRDPCAVQIDFGWEDLDDAAATLGIEVTLGSQAAKVGLQPGDVLLKINDRRIPNVQEFRKEFSKLRCRSHVTLQILRGRFLYYVTLDLSPSRS